MTPERDFFTELGRKVEKKVPSHLDHRILSQIPVSRPFISFKWMATGIGSACLSILIYFSYQTSFQQNEIIAKQRVEVMVDEIELFEYLEEFAEDEIDLTQLTEEEWMILLEGEEIDV